MEVFGEWKCGILNEVRNRLTQLPLGIQPLGLKSFIEIDGNLKAIKDHFIISYIDKAANSYAMTCIQLYYDTLKSVYADVDLYKRLSTSIDITKKRIDALYRRLGISNSNRKFPYLILVPKLHKTPVKFRPITVGCNTYIELANNELLKLLKILYIKIKHVGCNIIKNSYDVIRILNGLDDIESIRSYDIAELFNSIDLDDLWDVMMDMFMRFDLNQYVTLAKYKNLLQMVLRETYLFDGVHVYRQCRGIPMGGGGSAALADIYLFSYEYRNKFNNDLIYLRYVDDIFWALRSNELTPGFEFYPDYLRFVETACDEGGGLNFLDLTLWIENKKIMTRIYDKRNDYNFDTIRVMKWNSSVHIGIYRNIIAGYIDRCVKLNSEHSWTAECICDFKNRLIMSGYPLKFINCCLEASTSQLE
jgi:hypothetical protein